MLREMNAWETGLLEALRPVLDAQARRARRTASRTGYDLAFEPAEAELLGFELAFDGPCGSTADTAAKGLRQPRAPTLSPTSPSPKLRTFAERATQKGPA